MQYRCENLLKSRISPFSCCLPLIVSSASNTDGGEVSVDPILAFSSSRRCISTVDSKDLMVSFNPIISSCNLSIAASAVRVPLDHGCVSYLHEFSPSFRRQLLQVGRFLSHLIFLLLHVEHEVGIRVRDFLTLFPSEGEVVGVEWSIISMLRKNHVERWNSSYAHFLLRPVIPSTWYIYIRRSIIATLCQFLYRTGVLFPSHKYSPSRSKIPRSNQYSPSRPKKKMRFHNQHWHQQTALPAKATSIENIANRVCLTLQHPHVS